MSGISLDSFHLDFPHNNSSESVYYISTAISIRKTASLRLYRCKGQLCCCRVQSPTNKDTHTAENTKLAIFVPHSLTRSIVKIAEDHTHNNNSNAEPSPLLNDAELELRKSIHPCLVKNDNEDDKISPAQLYIREVVTTTNLPADIVLLSPTNDDSNWPNEEIFCHYSNLLNHETASNAPWSVIKAFPVSIFLSATDSVGDHAAAVPNCPVCLHLIDPIILGLPPLKPQHLCSPCCSNNLHDCDNINDHPHLCRNEKLFIPWEPPSHCVTCHIISNTLEQSSLMCHDCGMTSTLWICLTCGYIGCGRYTRKHAAQHYNDHKHAYSLELATGRIWDYGCGNFAHRKDLMECSVLSMKWGNADSSLQRQGSDYTSSSLVASSLLDRSDSYHGNSSLQTENLARWKEEESASEYKYDSSDEAAVLCNRRHPSSLASKSTTPPKKSIMVSLEYEALLQSALEDQSQHFEGEISRLRAELAASRLQDTEISDRESREIIALQKDCKRLNSEVEKLSSVLLDLQTEEAKHRATSQKLLREQTVSKDLLEKIRIDTTKVLESSDEIYEDLKLQISDLEANIRMMQQIAVDEELSQAQIFGTAGGVMESNKSGGKKSRRNNRKR